MKRLPTKNQWEPYLLQRNYNINTNTRPKLLCDLISDVDQHATPCKEPWIYQVIQLELAQKYHNPSNSIRCNCQKICRWTRRPEIILNIRKKAIFFEMINSPLFKSFSIFTNFRKKTNRAVRFSYSSLPKLFI